MTNRRRRTAAETHGAGSHGLNRVPVILPHLSIAITDTGADTNADLGQLTVTLDGKPYNGPADLGEGRSAVGPLIEQISAELGCPIRVEVREVDGTVFTEIVVPQSAPTEWVGLAPADPKPVTTVAGRLEVGGSGFDPDEQVAVAVVVAHQTAGPDGCARLRLPAALLASRPGTVVLLGRSSGFVAVSGNWA